MKTSFVGLAARAARRFAPVLLATAASALAGTITIVNGPLPASGPDSSCTYTEIKELASANWRVTCGTSSKTITFSGVNLGPGSCASYGTILEDSTGNVQVTGCVEACAPTATITTPAGAGPFVVPANTNQQLAMTATAACGASITGMVFVDATGAMVPGGTVGAPPPNTFYWTWTPSVGTYLIRARATDSAGRVSYSPEISVRGNVGPAVTFSVSPPGPIAGPGSFTLTATAADSDGVKRVEYRTSPGGTLIGQSTTGPSYSVSWNSVPANVYDVYAVAVDQFDAITESTHITVTVTGSNNPPAANVTKPTLNQAITGNVTLEATASDSDGTVIQVDYIDADTGFVVAGPFTTPPYAGTWVSPSSGPHGVRARATDNSGGVGLSPVRPFTINANSVPALAFTPSGGVYEVAYPGSVTVGVIATDPDGGSLTVTFANITMGTPIGSSSGASGSTFSQAFSPVAAGVFQVRATVTDGTLTASVDLWVTALAAPGATSVYAPKATSPIGAIAASFAVTEGGAASYSVPIVVPPGPSGMQPSLAMSYNSQGGNGPLGVGWSLSGVSSITRCPKTIGTDGVRNGINYDTDALNDAYCLDGQRLIQVGAPEEYAHTNGCGLAKFKTRYRTEIESYSLIIGYDEEPCLVRGMSRFEVLTKSGQWLMYGLVGQITGQTTGRYYDGDHGAWVLSWGYSQGAPWGDRLNTVKAWPLARAMDAGGNLIRYAYCGFNVYNAIDFGSGPACEGSTPLGLNSFVEPLAAFPRTEVHLKAIRYGGRADRTTRVVQAAPTLGLDFVYTLRSVADQIRMFDSGGGESTLSYALQSITTVAGSSAVMSYIPEFDLSPSSKRTQLRALRQCAGAVSNGVPLGVCLDPKTRFGYSDAQQGARSFSTALSQRNRNDVNFAGDVNGDGLTDLVYIPNGGVTIEVGLSTGSGFTWFGVTLDFVLSGDGERTLADFNGDGKVDLIVRAPDGTFRFCDLNVVSGTSTATCFAKTLLAPPYQGHYLQGDFNGDGRIDIMTPRPLGGPANLLAWALYLGDGQGVTLVNGAVEGLPNSTATFINEQWAAGDFNGDGRTDIIFRTEPTGCSLPGGIPQKTCGLASLKWRVCFSRPGATSQNVVFECPHDGVVATNGVLNKSVTVDFNGDGIADLAYPSYPTGTGNPTDLARQNDWNICLSAGDGSFQRSTDVITNDQYGEESLCRTFPVFADLAPSQKRALEDVVFGDFDGDGRTDMAAHVGNSSTSWEICFSRNSSIVASANSMTFECVQVAGAFPPNALVQSNILTGDFNGDGKTDLLGHHDAGQGSGGSSMIKIGFSVGTVPDLLTSVTNGLDATTEIDYQALTNTSGSFYVKGTSPLQVNELHIQAPIYAVKATRESNGINTTEPFAHTYSYTGLKGSTNGRGLLGFATRTETDTNGISRITTNNQSVTEWWRAGRPSRVEMRYGSQTLSDTRTFWQRKDVLAGVVQVHLLSTVEAKRDLDNSLLACTRSTLYNAAGSLSLDPGATQPSVDSYGNPITVYTDTGSCDFANNLFTADLFRKTTTNSYHSIDEANWIIGRLSTASVKHEGPSVPIITRASAFAYQGFGGTCNGAPYGSLCTETIEPGEPAFGDKRRDTSYQYDAWGNVVSTSSSFFDPVVGTMQQRGSTVSFSSNGRFPVGLTNSEGHSESRAYHAGFGTMISSTRYLGEVYEGSRANTTTTYLDGFGRKMGESVRGGDNRLLSEVDIAWSGASHPAKYKVTSRSNTEASSTVYFDSLQREVQTDRRGFANIVTSNTAYDSKGRKSTFDRPMGAGRGTTQYFYDVLNRITEERTTSGARTTSTFTTYAGQTKAIRRTNGSSPDRKTLISINSQGSVLHATECFGNTVEDNQAVCAISRRPVVTSYAYDATGNNLTVTSPLVEGAAVVRSATFDKLGRKLTVTDPDIGYSETDYNGAGEVVVHRYTQAAGLVESRTTRDRLGRTKAQRTTRAGAEVYRADFTYDTCQKGALCLRSAIDQGFNSVEQRSFDTWGRAFKSATTLGQGVTAVSAQAVTIFDPQSRPAQAWNSSGQGVRYEYSSWAGDLTGIRDHSDSTYWWKANSRFDDGHIAQMLVGGIQVDRAYDEFGLLKSSRAFDGLMQNSTYTFDPLGNLVGRAETANYTQNESFSYDSLNRLMTGGGAAMSYDDGGNIASMNGATYRYWPGTNRVRTVGSSAEYAYDGVGNLQAGGGRSMQWKAFNKVASITRSGVVNDWSYGPDLERVREQSSIGITLYFPGGEYMHNSPDGATRWRHYIATPEGTVGVTDYTTFNGVTTPERRGWLLDHLGSVVVHFDLWNQIGSPTPFKPWGERQFTVVPAPSTVQRGFTGHEMLDDVGLVNMNGRVYDPAIAKFLSADPYVQAPLDGQSFNRYSYVLNNPLSRIDPTGFSSLWVQVRRPVIAIAAAATMQYYAMPAIYGVGTFAELTAAQQMVSVVASGFAAGGIAGGNLQSALQGAFFAIANYGIGTATMDAPFENIAAHAAVGCLQQSTAGGSCKGGAFAGGFSSAAGHLDGFKQTGLIGETVVGAIASRLGGGRAANGALTGAFGYLFNRFPHEREACSSCDAPYRGGQTADGPDGSIPFTAAGDSAAMYWAAKVNSSNWYEDPMARFGLGLSVLWTEDTAANTFMTLSLGGTLSAGYRAGAEITFGKNVRIAPFGNRTGHKTGELPHYHRRGVDPSTGETLPGQGIGRHRPWDTKSPDKSWKDRF